MAATAVYPHIKWPGRSGCLLRTQHSQHELLKTGVCGIYLYEDSFPIKH